MSKVIDETLLLTGVNSADLVQLGWRVYCTGAGPVLYTGLARKTLSKGELGFAWHADEAPDRIISGKRAAFK
jgi:hypothetical protein